MLNDILKFNDILEFDGSLALSVMPEDSLEGEQESWQIKNDAVAGWAIEKIKFCRAELERKRRLAEEKKRQIDMWLKTEEGKTAKQITFFEQFYVAGPIVIEKI